MSENSKRGDGTWFAYILFLVLLVLKIAEVGIMKDASWWLVFIPFWGPLAILGMISIPIFIYYLIKGSGENHRRRRDRKP